MTPQAFEKHCLANYKIIVLDSPQWARYKALLVAQAQQSGTPARLDNAAPFEVLGALGNAPFSLTAQPQPLNYTVNLDGRTIARISDFTAFVNDRPDIPSSCDRFPAHAMAHQ